VPFVAVYAEQAEDWNGASGRHFIEQRERWERMRGRLTARLLAAAQVQGGENVLDIGPEGAAARWQAGVALLAYPR
jgi:hypothetical protein